MSKERRPVRPGPGSKWATTSSSSWPMVSVSPRWFRVTRYHDVESYLIHEGLRRCLPGVQTLEQGVNVYLKPYGFWDPVEVQAYGILAFQVERV